MPTDLGQPGVYQLVPAASCGDPSHKVAVFVPSSILKAKTHIGEEN